jgi:hypothetical protein
VTSDRSTTIKRISFYRPTNAAIETLFSSGSSIAVTSGVSRKTGFLDSGVSLAAEDGGERCGSFR